MLRGSKAAIEALDAVLKGAAEDGIKISKGLDATKIVIPTRQEAEKLIAEVGGRVERVETGKGATVSTHSYPHIQYSLPAGKLKNLFTIQVKSVGRQFFRTRRRFPRN